MNEFLVTLGGDVSVTQPASAFAITLQGSGPPGPMGPPGVTASDTAPIEPQLNQLWLDTSAIT